MNTVTLLGSGRIRDAIAAALAGWTPARDLAITATDGWDTSGHAAARATGVAWLPVRTELRYAVIGPLERPGSCVDCAEARRSRPPAETPESPWLTGLAAGLIGALAAGEALADRPRTHGAILVVRLDDLDIGTHPFLPRPDCPRCGALPDDAPAVLRLRPRPKPDPLTYRIAPPDRDRLLQTYVDSEVGLIRRVTVTEQAGVSVARAPVRLLPDGREESGWGRGDDAEAIAVLEALERYAGGRPLGRRTVVRAAAHDLGEEALDPRTLGLYPPQRCAEPGHRFPVYDSAAPRRWVWGYSFRRGRPLLVPEGYAYYRVPDEPLVYEPSNGCALGSCLEEAVLYGLLEVLERDAFLLTWHARIPAPRIPPGPLAATIERETGYAVSVHDTTPEHGIPCVLAMAVGTEPALAFAAAAHLDPAHAVRSALTELGPILAHQLRTYPAHAHRAEAMITDPHQVVEMGDHALLHGHPAARERANFLLAAPSAEPPPPPPRRPDLRDDLCDAIGRVLAAGLDVIVVDQTTPEHRAGGLACVKVIVPGALPMTFGHVNRRLDGLPRLLTVPAKLGHRAGVHELPHPFP